MIQFHEGIATKKLSDEQGEKVVDRVEQVKPTQLQWMYGTTSCEQKFYTMKKKWGYCPVTHVDEAIEVI